jgi:hypothetical protein
LTDYWGWGVSGCSPRCSGGANRGKLCLFNSECPGGRCDYLIRVCNGGLLSGRICTYPGDCPSAKCVKWSCDPVNHWCNGQQGIPYCSTLSDCNVAPYNKYCALDPNFDVTWWSADSSGNAPGCTFPGYNYGVDTCTDSVRSYGPCVLYATCTPSHQCVGSTVPCTGGVNGAGTICNNVCRSGHCASDYVACP